MRSFHGASVTTNTLKPILKEEIDAATYIMTDESSDHVGLFVVRLIDVEYVHSAGA